MTTLPKYILTTSLTNLGNDNPHEGASQAGLSATASTAATIGAATVSAHLAGAGALSGYAGMASAVSSLGLGGVTTAVASALGVEVTGAAATAVCVSFIGGPIVAGTALVATAGAVTYGVCTVVGSIWNSIFD